MSNLKYGDWILLNLKMEILVLAINTFFEVQFVK